jgi:tetratricopeptide (TPR) repeat protein
MTRTQTAIDALRVGNLDRAWSLTEEGLKAAPDARYAEFWQYAFVRAEVLRIRGRFEEALEYLDGLGTPIGLKLEILISYDMHRGYCLGLLGRYDSSRCLLAKAQASASDAGLCDLRCHILLREAMIMFLQRDYSNSGRIYQSVLDESRESVDWYVYSAALAGVGKVLMIQRQYSDAVPWLQRALAIMEKKQAKYAIARVWSDIAVCELGMGNPAMALNLLRSAERVNLELGALPNFQVCVANIGNIHCSRGDYLKAIAHYQRALKIARAIKDPVSIQKWSHNIEVAFSKSLEQAANPSFD